MSFRIGNLNIENPLVLAPMEDVSNLPFRLIAKRIGQPGLMFTEFVSAMAIHYGAKKTYKKLLIHPEERPLGIQIFGADPDTMVETALKCEEAGADLIDINMGCWVPKVCKTGAGAALIKDPELAEAIVGRVVRAVKVPVTVKVRAGWTYEHFAAPELAQRFQDQGIQALTLHARFAKQGFEGEADWTLIRKLREVLHVPLIGNGDVKTPEDACKMLAETGCDGVMVGRAAISNPWVLQRIHAHLTGQPEPPEPSIETRLAVALEHARLMVDYEREADELLGEKASANVCPEVRAIKHLRGQLALYVKYIHGAGDLRNRIVHCTELRELEMILQETYNVKVENPT